MIEIEYWMLTSEGYDKFYETVETNDVEEAIKTVRKMYPRAKDFKVYEKKTSK